MRQPARGPAALALLVSRFAARSSTEAPTIGMGPEAAVAPRQQPSPEEPLPPPPVKQGRGRLFRAAASALGARPALTVTALCLAAASWSLVESLWVFPYLSDNNDEAVYLLQADALRHGRLSPPAPRNGDAFLPWLSAQWGDRFVLKYTPVHAGIIAVSRTIAGSDRAALGLVAAGAVVCCYLLAREALGDRRRALIATAFFLLSPMFLIQSATFLPYLSALAILLGFGAALLRGVRRRSAGLLWLSGLLLGLAVFARPYEALLFAAPFGVWLIVVHRRAPGRGLADAGWLCLGAVLPLLAMLAFFNVATGSPFRSPFTILNPRDTIGFGSRGMIPTWPSINFTPARAWEGMIRHVALTGIWSFGGLALMVFAVLALVKRRSGFEPWLALIAVTIPLGYFFFWGSYGATMWGGPWRFGPFYYLPVFVPLAILGASGFVDFWARQRVVGGLTLVGMLVVSGFVLTTAQASHRLFTQERVRLYAGLRAATSLERAIVFLPQIQGPWLLQPFALARNTASYDGEVIWAIDRGDDENLRVLDEFRGRSPYRVRAIPVEGDPDTPTTLDFVTTLEPMQVERGPQVPIQLVVRNPTPSRLLFVDVTMGRRKVSFLLDTQSRAGKTYHRSLRIGAQAAQISGPVLSEALSASARGTSGVRVAVSVSSAAGRSRRVVAEHRLAVRRKGALVEVLLPGEPLIGETTRRAPVITVLTDLPGEPASELAGKETRPNQGPAAHVSVRRPRLAKAEKGETK